jgi:hypothetical protein
MRRLLALAAVVAGVAVSSVTAAPSDLKISVDGQAQYVSPTTLLLPVTYVCPASFGTASLFADVSQAETGASGFGFLTAPCTGQARTEVITINASTGPTFTLGRAVAEAFLFTGSQQASQQRRIQIVL